MQARQEPAAGVANSVPMITTSHFTIAPGQSPETLWTYTVAATGETFSFAPPVFEIDGQVVLASADTLEAVPDLTRTLANGVMEAVYRGVLASDPEMSLSVIWQVAESSPMVRFRYRFEGEGRLTKANGADRLTYLTTSFAALPSVKDVRLAEFNEMVHSYCLAEREIEPAQFTSGLAALGPILVGSSDAHSVLLAYEHGSQAPDTFLQYRLGADRAVSLDAVKGNYYAGQPADGYETLWLHIGAVAGSEDDLARAYRAFLLNGVTQNAESRQPYIFYNTWNFQERNRWWYGNPYLESMRQDRIEAEIEVAHQMGIDVFVLDTGWYEKTGDWQVNRQRFPDGLKSIKETLDGYGMKLGCGSTRRSPQSPAGCGGSMRTA